MFARYATNVNVAQLAHPVLQAAYRAIKLRLIQLTIRTVTLSLDFAPKQLEIVMPALQSGHLARIN